MDSPEELAGEVRLGYVMPLFMLNGVCCVLVSLSLVGRRSCRHCVCCLEGLCGPCVLIKCGCDGAMLLFTVACS